jgi:TetR/AcrR family transcriptional regulator, cholesterol catabolism regulator
MGDVKGSVMTLQERRERQRSSKNADRVADARWHQILAGASEVFRAKGYAQSTLRDVAEAVGIDRASLYYYVSSKEDLLIELVREPLTNIEKRINAILSKPEPPDQMLRNAIVSHLESYEAGWPESFVFLSQNIEELGRSANDFAELAKRYHAALMRIIRDGQHAGVFRADVDASVVMHGILGMCNWVHRWYHPSGRNSLSEIGEMFASMIIDGVRIQ